MAKKRVKMLTSMAAPNWSLIPGEITEVDAEVADAWSKAGIAELVVDDDVETASVNAPETAARRKKKGE